MSPIDGFVAVTQQISTSVTNNHAEHRDVGRDVPDLNYRLQKEN
jgi:hypothetical protein